MTRINRLDLVHTLWDDITVSARLLALVMGDDYRGLTEAEFEALKTSPTLDFASENRALVLVADIRKQIKRWEKTYQKKHGRR